MKIFKPLILIAIVLALTSCHRDTIKGEGAIVTKTLAISDFRGVGLTFASNILIKQGNTQEVKAIGQLNIINSIKTSVSSNFWNVGFKEGSYSDYSLSLEITIPNLDKISLSGSGDIILNKFEDLVNLDVRLSGSGDIKVNDNIIIADKVSIKNSGSGKYLGFKLVSDTANVKLSGSGKVEVIANSLLDVKLSGSGNIYYKKVPVIIQSISGSGNLIHVD